MTLVFVYGTLKRGGSNHSFMAGQEFVAEAATVPGFVLYNLGDFPGMVASPEGRRAVQGEVWGVDAPCLAQLDLLEGTGEGLYERVAIRLEPPFADQRVETYLYLRNIDGLEDAGPSWKI